MTKHFFSFLLLLSFAFSVLAQTELARKIDEFERIPCGDFMARMDGIYAELQKSPTSKIHLIYYGGQYRKSYSEWNQKTQSYNKLKLNYPHREDGLSWAKSIPLYLTSKFINGYKFSSLQEDQFVLVDGGFRKNTEVEIWLVPKDTKAPKPIPTIAEKDIKFRKDKPLKTPNFTNCYGSY